jgi:hypothetical protein
MNDKPGYRLSRLPVSVCMHASSSYPPQAQAPSTHIAQAGLILVLHQLRELSLAVEQRQGQSHI